MPLNPVPGTPEDDTLTGTGHRDLITGDAGNDSIRGLEGNDQLYGGDGRDRIDGGDGDNLTYGGAGRDLLYGGWQNDSIYGDAGDDQIFGSAGEDWVYGGAGNDHMRPGNNDHVDGHSYGGAGDDFIEHWNADSGEAYGGSGTDTIFINWGGFFGPGGNMTMILNGADRGVFSDTQSITFSGFERIVGWTGSGDDYVQGGALDDELYVGTGNDTLYGLGGDDFLKYSTSDAAHIYGGAGNDTIRIWAADFGGTTLTVTGSASVDSNGAVVTGAEHWQFYGNKYNDQATLGADKDTFHGSAGDDSAWGMGGNDRLHGGFGQDTLYGGNGGDWLQGSFGDDLLFGGAGADHFRFLSVGDFRDHVADFESGSDHLEINGRLLNDLLPAGAISAGQFSLGQAQGTGAQFILKIVTAGSAGELVFDADGTGEGSEILIAHLDGAPLITADDILIF